MLQLVDMSLEKAWTFSSPSGLWRSLSPLYITLQLYKIVCRAKKHIFSPPTSCLLGYTLWRMSWKTTRSEEWNRKKLRFAVVFSTIKHNFQHRALAAELRDASKYFFFVSDDSVPWLSKIWIRFLVFIHCCRKDSWEISPQYKENAN